MTKQNTPKDNGWVLRNLCHGCGWIGRIKPVCPSCGNYFIITMNPIVVRWVSTRKWYHFFMLERVGYWEKKI